MQVKLKKLMMYLDIDCFYVLISRGLECLSKSDDNMFIEEANRQLVRFHINVCRYKLYLDFDSNILNDHLMNWLYLLKNFTNQTSQYFSKSIRATEVVRQRIICMEILMVLDESTKITVRVRGVVVSRFNPNVLALESAGLEIEV